MIVIGIPVDKNHTCDIRTAAYCSAEAMQPGVKWGYCASKECGVGRSTFVHTALKDPEVTHVFNIDSDVVPPPRALKRLLDYDLPIVAGIYPTVTKDRKTWSFKMNGDSDWQSRDIPLPESLTKVTAIGGSTVLIKREVFENLEQPWFRATYRIEDGNYAIKEDEYFSFTARNAGYELFIDPTIVCRHYNYGEI